MCEHGEAKPERSSEWLAQSRGWILDTQNQTWSLKNNHKGQKLQQNLHRASPVSSSWHGEGPEGGEAGSSLRSEGT